MLQLSILSDVDTLYQAVNTFLWVTFLASVIWNWSELREKGKYDLTLRRLCLIFAFGLLAVWCVILGVVFSLKSVFSFL